MSTKSHEFVKGDRIHYPNILIIGTVVKVYNDKKYKNIIPDSGIEEYITIRWDNGISQTTKDLDGYEIHKHSTRQSKLAKLIK